MTGERIKMKYFVLFSPLEPGTEMKSYVQTATEDKQSGGGCAGLLEREREKKKLQEQQYNNNNNKIKGT